MTSRHDGSEPSSPLGGPQDPADTTQHEQSRSDEPWESPSDKPTAKEKTAAIKEQTLAKAKQATSQVREKAAQASELAKNKTPEPLMHTAAQTAAHVRDTAARAGHLAADKTPEAVREKAAHAAGSKWTPLLSAGAALLVFVLVRRSRRNRCGG